MVCEALLPSVISIAVVSSQPVFARRTDAAVTTLRLSSSDGGPLEMTPNAGGDRGFQLRCNGQVIVETDGYTAKADKFTFVSAKNLLIFESPEADAQLISRRDRLGQERTLTGRKIRLILATGNIELVRRTDRPTRPTA